MLRVTCSASCLLLPRRVRNASLSMQALYSSFHGLGTGHRREPAIAEQVISFSITDTGTADDTVTFVESLEVSVMALAVT